MTENYMDKGSFFEFLHDEEFDQFLHIDETEEFLVEVVCLNHWNETFDGAPDEDGINFEAYTIEYDTKLVVHITCDKDSVDPVYMVYTPSAKNLGMHELEIHIGENLIYWRTDDQDPATEWQINQFANDITDEEGNFVFAGEPVQV